LVHFGDNSSAPELPLGEQKKKCQFGKAVMTAGGPSPASPSHHSPGQQNSDSDVLTVRLMIDFHPSPTSPLTPPQAVFPNSARGSKKVL
jgi:hypothetical protein